MALSPPLPLARPPLPEILTRPRPRRPQRPLLLPPARYNVFKIHWLMAALAFTKSIALLFHSVSAGALPRPPKSADPELQPRAPPHGQLCPCLSPPPTHHSPNQQLTLLAAPHPDPAPELSPPSRVPPADQLLLHQQPGPPHGRTRRHALHHAPVSARRGPGTGWGRGGEGWAPTQPSPPPGSRAHSSSSPSPSSAPAGPSSSTSCRIRRRKFSAS